MDKEIKKDVIKKAFDFVNSLGVERNWDEDKEHENGNYFNQCSVCSHTFTGHKRRTRCKVCFNASPDRELVKAMTYRGEQWVSVKYRLPEIDQIVLGYFPAGDEGGYKVNTAINRGYDEVSSNYPNSTSSYFIATHWMPLPKPPTEC